jgi:hypothetical protein
VVVAPRPVDADGTPDNVRVISSSADLAARWRGFELAVEAYWRHERWGTILDHSDNAALRAAIQSDADGVRNYLGGYGALTYAPAAGGLLVGARVAETRLALLGVGGRALERRPLTDRLLEVDLTVQLIQAGTRTLGLDYTFFDYGAAGVDPAGDRSHRLILEYQWML